MRFLNYNKSKLSTKNRRHSGRVTPRLTIKAPKTVIINECLEPQPFYDDWNNHRDCFRGSNDKTLLGQAPGYRYEKTKAKNNDERLKLLEARRKARQQSPRNEKL